MLSRLERREDDLQSRVAMLPQLLAVKPISNEADAARRDWFEAIEGTRKARAALTAAAREGEDALKSAWREVERRAEKEKRLGEAFASAKTRVEAAFLKSTSAQLDEAQPILEDLTAAVADTLAVLETMQQVALRRSLPAPRLLEVVPMLREATRRLISELNRRRS